MRVPLSDQGAGTGYPPSFQRHGAERHGAEQHAAERPGPSYVPEQPYVPEQRGGTEAEQRGSVEQRGTAEPGADGRAQRRRGSTAVSPERRRPAALSISVLLALPLVAALISAGGGPVFDVGAVLGAGVAAALCSRSGAWWVCTATPLVVLVTALAGFFVRDSSGSTGKFATSLAKCVAGAFPAMGAALAVAVVVGVVRLVAARRGR